MFWFLLTYRSILLEKGTILIIRELVKLNFGLILSCGLQQKWASWRKSQTVLVSVLGLHSLCRSPAGAGQSAEHLLSPYSYFKHFTFFLTIETKVFPQMVFYLWKQFAKRYPNFCYLTHSYLFGIICSSFLLFQWMRCPSLCLSLILQMLWISFSPLLINLFLIFRIFSFLFLNSDSFYLAKFTISSSSVQLLQWSPTFTPADW